MTRHASRRFAANRRRLPWWIRRGVRAWARCTRWWAGRPAPRAWLVVDAADTDDLSTDEAQERRCGWFDSSQDLREGLCISEHASNDPVTAQLPVMAWVQLQLSGWRPAMPA